MFQLYDFNAQWLTVHSSSALHQYVVPLKSNPQLLCCKLLPIDLQKLTLNSNRPTEIHIGPKLFSIQFIHHFGGTFHCVDLGLHYPRSCAMLQRQLFCHVAILAAGVNLQHDA